MFSGRRLIRSSEENREHRERHEILFPRLNFQPRVQPTLTHQLSLWMPFSKTEEFCRWPEHQQWMKPGEWSRNAGSERAGRVPQQLLPLLSDVKHMDLY